MKLKGYSNSEMNMLNKALGVAMESDCKQRVGAVVVKAGKVLAVATNRDLNDPAILEQSKVYMHAAICAERRALAMISDDMAKGAVVYVARAARKDDNFACSKPCERCQKVMKSAGVKRAVYID